ncbi:Gfo/Idh/MocA family oxidoreductase [Segetibacter sp.]|jgi:predicted dehydrogenase|uniref:Gfo/Idh/MocA family protein n=1 Tax=Segetibacter sp. TaxID=2231182 RepID=UPI0026225AFA|nr:Gfo/Idh/MocA family oxidoreductase [Segetibacter sp.]
MEDSRRAFIKNSMKAATAVSIGGILPGFSAKSYASIIGANDRIMVASMGVNSRGFAVGSNFAKQENCEVLYACDVDTRAASKYIAEIQKITKKAPKAEPDFRKALEDKQLDALIVAAPDHWHAPAAILACKAGKHVYLEKPCSHNPHEGELVIAAAKKYDRVLQMGNQRRSFPNVIAAMAELKAGAIGRPYFAKTWYTNNRPTIGIGKEVAVPEWLNYELWQGPAPRKAYKDNIVHYNWHWLWNWGTGEALNNGTHMVDIARWGLGVEYPTKVSSNGGRYRYKDDWETPDTQVINLEFENNTFMTWEGRSCNGKTIEGSSVGVMFYGETGSLLIEAGNAYTIFDLDDKIVKDVKNTTKIDPRNLANPAESLDSLHIRNFFDGIRKGAKVNSDIVSGHQSTLLVQLGNIALRSGDTLNIDPKNGHILNNKEANKYWRREYAPGWEPKV